MRPGPGSDRFDGGRQFDIGAVHRNADAARLADFSAVAIFTRQNIQLDRGRRIEPQMQFDLTVAQNGLVFFQFYRHIGMEHEEKFVIVHLSGSHPVLKRNALCRGPERTLPLDPMPSRDGTSERPGQNAVLPVGKPGFGIREPFIGAAQRAVGLAVDQQRRVGEAVLEPSGEVGQIVIAAAGVDQKRQPAIPECRCIFAGVVMAELSGKGRGVEQQKPRRMAPGGDPVDRQQHVLRHGFRCPGKRPEKGRQRQVAAVIEDYRAAVGAADHRGGRGGLGQHGERGHLERKIVQSGQIAAVAGDPGFETVIGRTCFMEEAVGTEIILDVIVGEPDAGLQILPVVEESARVKQRQSAQRLMIARLGGQYRLLPVDDPGVAVNHCGQLFGFGFGDAVELAQEPESVEHVYDPARGLEVIPLIGDGPRTVADALIVFDIAPPGDFFFQLLVQALFAREQPAAAGTSAVLVDGGLCGLHDFLAARHAHVVVGAEVEHFFARHDGGVLERRVMAHEIRVVRATRH
ncbi:hypothetical protein SDC9_108245 [bioreactor metagenome]|uniref:Uncharacterized protein n=1 Tax=bioreactor metagenome TaxID=1076179 RepID=A0A645B7L1_9ZZZZ